MRIRYLDSQRCRRWDDEKDESKEGEFRPHSPSAVNGKGNDGHGRPNAGIFAPPASLENGSSHGQEKSDIGVNHDNLWENQS